MEYRHVVLFIVATLLVLPFLQSTEAYRINCTIDTSNPDPAFYERKHNVSLQGHLPGGVTYGLYCSNLWDESTTTSNVSFKYSDPNSGHVENASEPNYNYTYNFGTGVTCTYRAAGSCDTHEVCAFEMSNITNAHVSDCSAEVPESEDYGGRLCCEVREVCYNGIDDDDDGYTDCADTECLPDSPSLNLPNRPGDPPDPDIPQECDLDPSIPLEGNMQNTTWCVNNPGNCTTWAGNRTYCGYGEFDDPTKEPVGVCCPKGYVPTPHPLNPGEWECSRTDECGLKSFRPSSECAYNISSQESDFFADVYDGDASNFCNSQVPELFEEPGEQDAPEGSAACCYVPHKGIEDWWFKDGNVQIYG